MKTGSIKNVIEILGINKNGRFLLKNGEQMDMMRIVSKDLNSLSNDEVEYLMLKWAKIYKIHSPDIKIICMNFPCNTTSQQEFLQKKIQKTNNEVYKETLRVYLDELMWLQENDTTRNFYLLIFASSDEEMDQAYRRWSENLGVNKNGLLKKMEFKEKLKIWTNLLNKGILFRA